MAAFSHSGQGLCNLPGGVCMWGGRRADMNLRAELHTQSYKGQADCTTVLPVEEMAAHM